MKTKTLLVASAVALGGAAAVLWAQNTQPQPEPIPSPDQVNPGTMLLKTQLGSFQLEGEGTVEMTFRGTLLIERLDGAVTVVGQNKPDDIRLEFEGYDRKVWFGRGKAVIRGKFRRLQWFGGDLDAVWRGKGLAYVFGEYDPVTKSSGVCKVDDLPWRPWFTTGQQFWVPKELEPLYVTGQIKPEGSGGSDETPEEAPPSTDPSSDDGIQ